MSELINYVLNSKLKDLPREVYLQFNYGEYSVEINFQDDLPHIRVNKKDINGIDRYTLSERIYTADPEAKVIGIIEDTIKQIEEHKVWDIVTALVPTEKYKPKTKKKEEKGP